MQNVGPDITDKSKSRKSTIGGTKRKITENQFFLLILGGFFLVSIVASALLLLFPIPKPYANGIGVLVFSVLLYWYPPFRKGRLHGYQWFLLSIILAALMTAIHLLIHWFFPGWF